MFSVAVQENLHHNQIAPTRVNAHTSERILEEEYNLKQPCALQDDSHAQQHVHQNSFWLQFKKT
jgi:hypothetical protein